ncbi:magnesium-translocating P-type ATPase [Caenimonas aquaedulcis]|uniref:Magnesium-transporting ATPase, P-type 1 n=1 Tax=Caenimonas aquaedulcis TaxID=2793270 RepID=A0A931MIY7_9BURK|nr:magnesium-translocating P-type ATPase [Caenimonas aquaedulcis]MBG9390213.1 magnesium-translocating P-type ATPase [Caenimonas aquaedulcis]
MAPDRFRRRARATGHGGLPAGPGLTAGDGDWWRLGPADALRALGSSPAGLDAADAARRLAREGGNRLAAARRKSLVASLGQRLRNPLVLVLLAAGAVSLASGESASAGIIGAVVLLSVLLDQAQQYRAQAAVGRLALSIALRARVVRGGADIEVDAADLVPGDVVRLTAGSLVSADGLLLQGQDLFVQQSALTGESFPVEKRAVADPSAQDPQQAPAALFMGSSVISGAGTMVVCDTGMRTRMGAISQLVAGERGDQAFEADLNRFGAFILRITIFLVLFVVLVSGMAHRPWLDSFLFAVALAVGLTPELLPMVVTLGLSRGAMRLARQEVIVKHLSAMHNLGAMDVLCTDKTGTLTEARIELARHVDIEGRDSAAVLEGAFLNSFFESGIRTPLEDAVLAHRGVDTAGWRKIDEVPFDFERRRLSVLLERGDDRRLIVKGAPEDVLRHCDRYQQGDAFPAWTPAARRKSAACLHALESSGFRVLGIAWKCVPRTLEDAGLEDENALVFAGFAAFLDPPKADAGAAIADLQARGVGVKVVSGDSDLVTRHVCEALGMRVEGVLLGHEIAAMDDRALAHRAQACNLFCRVDPIQKNRVIRALRARGHVVGYLGDGINDAPALHSADVGISVDSACDSARAAADLVLLRHDLGVLGAAVGEGRRTIANTRKYILLGTSSNFGNMASMAAAAVFLPFLPMLPVQILLNNLLYDGVSAALPLDRVDAQDVAAPVRWDIARLRRFMLVIGPVSSLFDIGLFVVLLHVLDAAPAQFQSAWFLESLATQVLAVFVIRTRGPAIAGRPHPAVAAAALAVLSFAAVLPFTPLGAWFGLVGLPASFYLAITGMTVSYLLLLELVKRRFYRSRAARKIPRAAGHSGSRIQGHS